MEDIIKTSRVFLETVEQVRQNGYKKKEIAAHLRIAAPVFSSLCKTVLPRIALIESSLPNKEKENKIKEAFSLVNNLSQQKTAQSIDKQLEKLNELKLKTANKLTESGIINKLKQSSEYSFDKIKKDFEGYYDLYYIADKSNCVICEPLTINCDENVRNTEIIKGNKKSYLSYYGTGIIIQTHTLLSLLTTAGD